jgi:hypothetical protein
VGVRAGGQGCGSGRQKGLLLNGLLFVAAERCDGVRALFVDALPRCDAVSVYAEYMLMYAVNAPHMRRT